jgi:hypothetical protein
MLSERVSGISDQAVHILAELRHPVRLPILLALEERPRSPSEMAAAGLIEPVRQERAGSTPNLLRRVYGSRYRGWPELVATLEAIVASGKQPD